MPRNIRLVLPLAVLALVALAALLVGQRIATARAGDAVAARARISAMLLAASFRRELDKFRLVGIVLADDAEARAALATRDPARLATLNRKLAALARQTDAAAVYLLDARGRAVAASNADRPESFVDTDYAFRAYFRDALRDGQAQQFALGTRSGRPGLYLANRVSQGDRALGVFVVKVDFAALETEWRDTATTAFATDRRGIILVTSNPAWRFQTIRPISPAERDRARQSLDYGTAPLTLSPLYAGGIDPVGRIDAVARGPGDWRVHVIASTESAVRSARTSVRLAVALVVLSAIGVWLLWRYRRRRAAARIDRDTNARLAVLNDRLLQANKLATLGQITAGVGHEINQPLAAIASYAHNARQFLQRDRPAEAADAIERIAALTTRIGTITGELRNFARRSTNDRVPVIVGDAIAGACLLLRDRIRTLGASIDLAVPPDPVRVMADHVRLEQVLVNLLQNALDAGARHLSITVAAGDKIRIVIADDGPGLTPETRAGLFQPFTTSKADGLGLGLVISRDIVVDLGGTLEATHPATGAEFVVTLEPAS